MIERRVERDRAGAIERITERQMSPIEEAVALAWPAVKHALRRRDVVDLEGVELTITGVAPRSLAERAAIVNGLMDNIIAEADDFVHTRWREIVFSFPQERWHE